MSKRVRLFEPLRLLGGQLAHLLLLEADDKDGLFADTAKSSEQAVVDALI